ncbi:hypothetical protein SFUMM280S_07032 [Streptomyces fumanus]
MWEAGTWSAGKRAVASVGTSVCPHVLASAAVTWLGAVEPESGTS